MRVGIVVPHIFMQEAVLPKVIFSPGELALALAEGLERQGLEVFLFTPGRVRTSVRNITADLSYFEQELARRGDGYMDLVQKHPFTFITLARQVQAELIAKAYAMANNDDLDLVHIYTNEEDFALPFAALCTKPVVFTHHDPFNFLVKYKNVFPKYRRLNWVSLSYEQRAGMPKDTNWVGNVYHGLPDASLAPLDHPSNDYVAYLGRIVEPKGLHIAMQAVALYNTQAARPITLKIAGKHYAGHAKDTYWQERIMPQLDKKGIEYIGCIPLAGRREFLGNARALIVPSLFAEPFGMVCIEALACGTPVIGLDSGAIPEIIKHGVTGCVITKREQPDGDLDEAATAQHLAESFDAVAAIDRAACRQGFEQRFTAERMCRDYADVYRKLTTPPAL